MYKRKVKSKSINCSLCSNKIETNMFGWNLGNNPHPLMEKDDDRCCDSCNTIYVNPSRILLLMSNDKEMKSIVNKKGWLNNVRGTMEMIRTKYKQLFKLFQIY